MKCPSCQSTIPPGSHFCNHCGQKISTTPSEKTTSTLSHEDQLSRIQKYLPRGLAEKVLAQRDKIHWVDTSSLELIEALFRLVEEYRILFILVFRPGYAKTNLSPEIKCKLEYPLKVEKGRSTKTNQ